MNNQPFSSANVSWKRVSKVLVLSMLCIISLWGILSHFYNLIDSSLRDKYTERYCITDKDELNSEPLVLGTTDISRLNKDDYRFYEDADVFTNEEWEPEGYIKANTLFSIPQYNVAVGTTIKDKWLIGDDDYLYLECYEVDEETLQVPPYWSSCSLKINDVFVTDGIRADIYCDDYGEDFSKPTGCNAEVYIIMYSDENLDSNYLLVSKGYVGSTYGIQTFKFSSTSFYQLFFDYRDVVTEDTLVRGGMDLYLAFTDSTKSDFRLVTYFSDPSMVSISAIYNEWKVSNGRLLLDKKIVAI